MNDQVKYWKCVAGALIQKLQRIGYLVEVSQEALDADPPCVYMRKDPTNNTVIFQVANDAK